MINIQKINKSERRFSMIHSRDRPLKTKSLCKMKKDNKILKTSILEEKVMTKKIVSVVLVIITILSTLAITASAASYSTGNYVIAANNGSNGDFPKQFANAHATSGLNKIFKLLCE